MDEQFKSLVNHPDYDLAIDGLTIRVKNGVFSPDPAFTNSTSIILKNFPEVAGKHVLDIGAGTGIIGLRCALNGAMVVASDVSDAAIENIKENIGRFSLTGKIEPRISDLFSNIPESFDYIFANLPILDEVWSKESGGALQMIKTFLDQLPGHLNQGGTAYLAWGSFADVEPMKTLLENSGLNVRETTEVSHGYTWHLFTLTKT